ncbi:tannase/feruloyl esterase family alpha/beta hydrolase [Azohydromonas aeria]|uniref:tannase/feruloyl esterase family alpha/beta hydrolase n=1 Tax=Azohydromonas aeria TaxID=2590212 RepID=UPI0012F94B1D|nr:tannase/feruloyl esterase family alpha/beta hydrolase [Azohydromonas aeria]
MPYLQASIPSRPGILAAACATLLTACGGGSGTPATPPAETALALSCEQIAQQALAGTTLSATSAAAGTVVQTVTLPEHCVVTGKMNPRTGSDGKPYHTGFELRLPKAWNGRFMFQGGGGNDGVVRPAIGALAGNEGSNSGLGTSALAKGFAVVTTDAGHQVTDASFGLDAQARIDHAYNSYDKVTLAAKDLIARAYGRAPDRSYFVGCSGGGRQALLFPQRFPNHFDGVAANAPAIKVAKEATLASVWSTIGYTNAAPVENGARILSKALSDADLKLVSNKVLERCDGLDGAVDGIVAANPSACNFDPAVLQCSGAKTAECLTAEQVTALKRDFGGPRNSTGQQLYATWPWDAGISAPDWRNWRLGTSTTAEPNSRNATLIAGDAMKLEFFTPPDPSFDYLAFNFDTDPARLDAYAAIYNTTSTDVAAFKARGGKMLLVHGTSDAIFSANDTIDYYGRLAEANGGAAATGDFARLFLVPGMNHCSNSRGPATDLYDALTPLVEWVEKGTAPESIVAKASATSPWPGRTRPLCPYPKVAKYAGSGSIEDAASFRCE